MRILVLSHEYPPIGGGGGRVAQDLCEGLAARGHQVALLTARLNDLPYEETLRGVRVRRIRSLRREPYRAGLAAMAGYLLAGLPAGLRWIREFRPEVIHVHFAVPAGALAYALSRLTGLPYVLTAHLGDVPGGVPEKTGGWFRYLLPFTGPIWRRARRVAAVSGFTRELALRHYPVEIRVVPNGVDLAALDPGPLRVHAPARIVFAGRFVPQKNPVQLIEVLGALRDLPWECTLAGDGPLRPQVEQAIDRLGLRERVRLLGWVTPEQVIELFRAGDLLCMPSLSEGLPVVGVQALALGLAIVATRAGGWVDLVAPGENGALCPVGDAAALEGALRALLNDPAALLRARQRSRELAGAFDLDAIVRTYEALFEEARA